MTNWPASLPRPLVIAFLMAWAWPACAADQARRVAGLIETVVIGSPGAEFEAKLDTGADLSSISATDMTQTRRDGRPWMEFEVVRFDGTRVMLSGPLVRHTRIRRGGAAHVRRPVVELELCLGAVTRTVQVTLANRQGLNYDVLVGRNFLKGYFMVDPMLMHTRAPKCPVRAAK